MKVTALAALVGLMGSASAFADPIELKTTITVEGAEKCTLDVSALGETKWNLDWGFKEGEASGTLTPGAGHQQEPLFVKVKFTDDSSASCSLNAMKVNGASTATASAESQNAFRALTNDAYWRFMPVMAQLKLFTDTKGADNSTSGAIDLDKVTVVDRRGSDRAQKSAASHAALTEVANLEDFKNSPAVALTNNYLADNGFLPLAGDGSALGFKVAGLADGESVKSALIGVGALVAKNPEAQDGAIKLDGIEVGQEFSMPYTVDVTVQ